MARKKAERGVDESIVLHSLTRGKSHQGSNSHVRRDPKNMPYDQDYHAVGHVPLPGSSTGTSQGKELRKYKAGKARDVTKTPERERRNNKQGRASRTVTIDTRNPDAAILAALESEYQRKTVSRRIDRGVLGRYVLGSASLT